MNHNLVSTLPLHDVAKIADRPGHSRALIGRDAVNAYFGTANFGRPIDGDSICQNGDLRFKGADATAGVRAVAHLQEDCACRAFMPFYADEVILGPTPVDDSAVAGNAPGIGAAVGRGFVSANLPGAERAHAVHDGHFPFLHYDGQAGLVHAFAFVVSGEGGRVGARLFVKVVGLGLGCCIAIPERPEESFGSLAVIQKLEGLPLADKQGIALGFG